MMGFVIAIHVIACALLIIIILVQAGRGGGLVEGFSGVESMFGPKTSAFLTKATSILSTLFFITCISLAFLSARQSKSLMAGIKTQAEQKPAPEAASPAAPAAEPAQTQPVQTQDAVPAK
ncbi:MAG: preprotein translocase subunit SecG [Candidatus Omnitrophota bacterium]